MHCINENHIAEVNIWHQMGNYMRVCKLFSVASFNSLNMAAGALNTIVLDIQR